MCACYISLLYASTGLCKLESLFPYFVYSQENKHIFYFFIFCIFIQEYDCQFICTFIHTYLQYQQYLYLQFWSKFIETAQLYLKLVTTSNKIVFLYIIFVSTFICQVQWIQRPCCFYFLVKLKEIKIKGILLKSFKSFMFWPASRGRNKIINLNKLFVE